MGMTIGCTSEIKEKLRFSLYFARFALSLRLCLLDRLRLGNKRKTLFLFVFRSVCTIFATSIYEVLTKNYRMK